MPKLLLFVPCQRAIINERDNTISVIQILQNVDAHVPAGDVPPEDAAVPFTWDLVTLWQQLPEDDGVVYEQQTYLLLPNGTRRAQSHLVFELPVPQFRVISTIAGVPIGIPGEAHIILELKRTNGVNMADWEIMADFPITIGYKQPEDSPPTN